MKKVEKSKLKRVFEATLVAVCVLAVIVFAYADNKDRSNTSEIDDTSNVPVIESSVTIGKKTYTKDRPLKILEIVPLDFQKEMGYLIGADYYTVKFEDIKELIVNGNPNGKGLLQTWANNLSGIYGGQYSVQFYVKGVDGTYGWCDGFPYDSRIVLDNRLDYRIIDNNGNIYRYKDENGNVVNSTNIFAKSVFGDYNMADKIVYEAKCPSELTQADIDEADLIYINTAAGMRDERAVISVYKQANEYMPDKYPMTKNGVVYDSGRKFSDIGEDFSADIAWYLYRAIVAEDIAIVYDVNMVATYFGDNSIAIKLLYLLNGADRDKFKEHFWQNENVAEKSYSGTMGTFEIVNNTWEIRYTWYNMYDTWTNPPVPTPNKLLDWGMNMFNSDWGSEFLYSLSVREGNDDSKNYYFYSPANSGDSSGRSTNVWNNVFMYGDWNTLLQKVPAGNIDNVNKDMTGSSYDDVYHLYGSDGKVSVGLAIRYILGDYSKLYGTLKVLEIEPAGEYKYNELTDEQASRILRYLQISIKNLTDGSIASHVDVKSVAMNEFIAMTEDIKNNYDLVIIGDLTNASYKDTFLDYAYSEYGKPVYYTNYNPITTNFVNSIGTVYSGNDLTDNAYDKLKNYIESGKPMVLADSIYSGDKSVIDEKSNVYKLKALAESSKNTTDESMTSGDRLKYIERPFVSVDKYHVTYKTVNVNVAGESIDTKIAEINLAREALSGFDFNVNVGDATRGYELEIYVDKNGDGLFAGTKENNEVAYSGNYGDFNNTITLPTGIRGYLKWKVVLTDTATGMSAEDEGAFVIGYGSDEKTTVKLLQICPEGNTLSLKTNVSFLNLFEASSDITGLEMTADDVTVMTTTEYEQWYAESPYYADTKAGDKLSKDGDIGFDIIVMGFQDVYGSEDISDDNGALSNLVDYIEAGNSVLMSHDVLSYSSYSDTSNTNLNVSLKNSIESILGWSYNITSRLRNIIGMDRYGVAVEENKNTQSLYGSGIGYTNSLNVGYYRDMSGMASQINNGQINMYPYEIGDEISVERTHAQYFQLDLNSDDIVVWYALSGDEGDNKRLYFNMSGHDALNNYYIYSKGNITYTGAGHSALGGSGIELQLFVNTIIKAIGSANSIPVVEFDNAIKIDNYSYEMAIRDGKLPEKITFTVTDRDFLGDTSGTFKEGFVFFDVDGDNRYIEGTDILFVEYDDDDSTPAGYLWNMTPVTLDFAEIISEWKNSGDSKKTEDAKTIEEAFENNQLRIKVQAKDNNNGIGRGTLNILNKQLFNLN